jgi:hypothetical protein
MNKDLKSLKLEETLSLKEEWKSFDFYSIKPDQDVGYIFQCSLTLPTDLH